MVPLRQPISCVRLSHMTGFPTRPNGVLRICALVLGLAIAASSGAARLAAQDPRTSSPLVAAVMAADTDAARRALIAADPDHGGPRFHLDLTEAVAESGSLAPARTVALLEFSAALAREKEDARGLAMSLMKLGTVHTRQGHYEDALRSAEQALAISTARHYTDLEARLRANIGIVHRWPY